MDLSLLAGIRINTSLGYCRVVNTSLNGHIVSVGADAPDFYRFFEVNAKREALATHIFKRVIEREHVDANAKLTRYMFFVDHLDKG